MSVSGTTLGRMIYRNGNAAPVFWCPACPNAFRSSHQLWLNTCFCGGTKRTNPICISDILNITQSPDITGWAFSAGWNSKTYFSNLWTDYKSKLRPAHSEIYISAKKKKKKRLEKKTDDEGGFHSYRTHNTECPCMLSLSHKHTVAPLDRFLDVSHCS